MAKGFKSGGRKAGTRNKRTLAVVDRLEALGCDPIGGMVEIAKEAHRGGDLALAGQMYKELAQYVHPKRKAVELNTGPQETLPFTIELVAPETTAGPFR